MTLAAGDRLGPYEILAPIGAGGMGEVYRAKDTKLHRDVAIKVLPESLSNDPGARARFEREAHAVAALNHPNILSIFDFGMHDGIAYAVMELLEGETLRDRLEGGSIPGRKAVELAAQAARGLAAAHEKGIVHRDLKPENLFVTADGRLKILDFGLAKHEAAPDPALTNSPTAAPSTQPGTVLGTVGYMSPEQVRGFPADSRSDIFSLGAVLYEMATGRRAFQRGTAAETMTAILREEPPAPGPPDAISPALDRVIRHCLEKSPAERFRSAHDLAFDLDALAGGSTAAASSVASATARNRRRLLPVIAAVAIAFAAFIAGTRTSRRPGSDKSSVQPRRFVHLTDYPGVESQPTLSPDGKSVVYMGDAGGRLALFLLRVGGRNPVALTSDSHADDSEPAFSPDGERIAFRSERDGGGIFVMGSTGESVNRLTDFGYNPCWSPDGRQIVFASGVFYSPSDRGNSESSLSIVDVGTGKKHPLPTRGDAVQPSWSPHGTRIAYWGLRGDGGQRDIFTVAADGSEKAGIDVTRDAPLDWSPVWSPDGRFLYFSSNRGGPMNLWRVGIDEASGRVLGPPEPVTTPSAWTGGISFSRDGSRFAYESIDWRSTLLKVGFDAAKESLVGTPAPVLKSTEVVRDHDISPDGQQVAFMQTGSQEDLAVARMDGTEFRRLTDDVYRDRGPAWSPDGSTIAFYSDRGGNYEAWSIRPDGSHLEQLTKTGGSANFPAWSPDGSQIAESLVGQGWGLIDMRAPGSPKVFRMIASPPGREFWPFSWSPDGRKLIGLIRRKDGSFEGLGTYSFETARYEDVRTAAPGTFQTPLWLADSRRFLLRSRNGISLVDAASGRSKLLIPVGGYAIGLSVGITKDNRWITWTETGTEGDLWLAEMK